MAQALSIPSIVSVKG